MYDIAERVMVCGLEGSPGTAETLDSSDFDVRMRGIEFTPDISMDDEASSFATGDYLGDEVVHGTQAVDFNIETKIADGDAIYTAPKQTKLFQMCGLKQTVHPETGVSWQDVPEMDITTGTFENYRISKGASPTGIKQVFAGCMGNLVLSAENIGAPVKAAYSFKGKYVSSATVANGSLLSLTDPDTSVAKPFLDNTTTIGSYSACTQNFTLDFGNTINNIMCNSESTGILHATIAGKRTPNLSLGVLLNSGTFYDERAKIVGEVIEEIVIPWGNWTIKIPRAQVLAAPTADFDGLEGLQLSIKPLRNGGEDSDISDKASIQILQGH